MITVDRIEDAQGRWVNDYVRVLTVPKLEDGRYTALAQVGEMLCLVELRITPSVTL